MLQLDNINGGSSSQGYNVTSNGNSASTTTTTAITTHSINNSHGLAAANSHQTLAPSHFLQGGAGLVPNAHALSAHSQGHGLSSTMHWGTAVFNPIAQQIQAQQQQQQQQHHHLGKPLAVQPGGDKNDNPSDEDDDDEYRPFTPPPPRERLSYTRYQLGLLNGIYEEVRYPNSTQKQLIAKRVGITREQVKIWFQNRRRKDVVSKTGTGKPDGEDSEMSNPGVLADDSQSPRDVNPTRTHDSNKDNDGLGPNCLGETSASTSQDEASSVSTSLPRNRSESTDCPNTPEDADMSAAMDSKDDSATDRALTPTSLSVSKLVSPLVLKSMIAELNKFDNEYLKQKKNKKKSKSKSARHAAAAAAAAKSATPNKTKRLFQSYDMIAPPNKVTPSAFLNTSANRFKHAGGTSAFQNPRQNKLTPVPSIPTSDNRLWEGFSLGHNPSLNSHLEAAEILQQRASMEQSMIPNSFAPTFGLQSQPPHHSALGGFLSGSTAAAVHHLNTQSSLYENLPVLSELLSTYKNQPHASAAAVANAQRHFEHSLLSSQAGAQQSHAELFSLNNVTSGGAAQGGGNACINNKANHVDLPFPSSPNHPLSLNSRHHPPSFGLNHRMFPFPLIADPPVMLSNLRQTEPLKPQPQWPPSASSLTHPNAGQITPGNSASEESPLYRPLAISSLSNPYFSPSPTVYSFPPSLQPPTHIWPTSSPSSNPPSDFAQL